MSRIPPDPDCLMCGGTGYEQRPYIAGIVSTYSACDCTFVCPCGEPRPNGLTTCASPGCSNQGCDACDAVLWCGDEHDEACGDYFCAECCP